MSRIASKTARHDGETLLAKQEFCIYIYHKTLMQVESKIREVIFEGYDGGIYEDGDWDKAFDKAQALIFAAE